jgi:hypothetical protein
MIGRDNQRLQKSAVRIEKPEYKGEIAFYLISLPADSRLPASGPCLSLKLFQLF